MAKLYPYAYNASNTIDALIWLTEPGVRFDGFTMRGNTASDTSALTEIALANTILAAKPTAEIGTQIGWSSSMAWTTLLTAGELPADPRDIGIEIDEEITIRKSALDTYIAQSVNLSYLLTDYEMWSTDGTTEVERAIAARYNLIRSLYKYYYPNLDILHYIEFQAGISYADRQYHYRYVEGMDTDTVGVELYRPTNTEATTRALAAAQEKAGRVGKSVVPTVSIGAGYAPTYTSPWDYDLDYSYALGELLNGMDVQVYPPPIINLESETVHEKHFNAFLSTYRASSSVTPTAPSTGIYRMLYKPQASWYMRIVDINNNTVYDSVAGGMVSYTSDWSRTIVALTWNASAGGYEVHLPVSLPNGRYDLLYYNAATPSSSDVVQNGEVYNRL